MDPLRPASPPHYATPAPMNNSKQETRKPQFTFTFSDSPKKYQVFITGKDSFEVCEEENSSQVVQAKLYDPVSSVDYVHEWDGKFYLAFRLAQYTAYSVYCFDRTKGKLECITGNVKRPDFIGNRLVEFGTGCDDNRPEFTGFAITFYDLDKAEKPRQCGKIIESVGRYWSLSVNHQDKTIEGCDQTVYNKTYPIPGLRVK